MKPIPRSLGMAYEVLIELEEGPATARLKTVLDNLLKSYIEI